MSLKNPATIALCILLLLAYSSPKILAQDEISDSDIINDFIVEHLKKQQQQQGQDPTLEPDSIGGIPFESFSINPLISSATTEGAVILPPFPQKQSTTTSEEQSDSDESPIPPAAISKVKDEVITETEPCQCVKYFLCDIDNGTVIDNGDVAGLIDIRLGTKSPCSHYFDICCKVGKVMTADKNIQKPSRGHQICGQRNQGGVGFRITGATDGESQFGEFPWMAAIVRQENQGDDKPPLNIFVCGGSLIHPKVVLTAAHCVFGKPLSELKVRLGEWDTQTLDELYQHQDRFVSKIIVHEDYYMGALYNDVALVFLDEDVAFAPNVDTVCLPPPDLNVDGQRCVASGWGKDSFEKEGKYQVILKKLDLPIVPTGKCESALRKTRLGPYFKLHSSFVCAGGEQGKDTCRGDGGSPLVCQLPNSGQYVQYGIVAWGIGCGEGGLPGVYVNIPKFVPWIDLKMSQAGLDTKYYKDAYN